MIKNRKVQRMLAENNLEQGSYSLVLRLKRNIEDLHRKIEQQDEIISRFKRDVKTTKINEMEVEIQHLNDENKRLLLTLEDLKSKPKSKETTSSKKHLLSSQKYENRRPLLTEFKCDGKMSDLLKENEHLRKELINLKVNQSFYQKRKTNLNDRNSIFLERNLIEV